MCRSLLRRVFLKLRQFRVHRVPWLRVRRKNFILRFVHTRIVHGPSRNALSEIGLATEQSRAAFRTKTAHIVAHHFARCAEVFRHTLGNPERVRRHIKNRCVSSAGCFLTIAAVTIESHNWFRGNFITNGAAGAATGNRFHFVTPKLMKKPSSNLGQFVRPRLSWLSHIAWPIALSLSTFPFRDSAASHW